MSRVHGVLDTKESEESAIDATYVQYVARDDMYDDGAIDPVYQAKTRVLNNAIQEIGMGRYQWTLFVVAGFGRFVDSLWPILTGLILSPVVAEFRFDGLFMVLAMNIGLFVGAVFWGVSCDIWGRRWPFNLTLLITGIFGTAAGASPNFFTLVCLIAIMGVGVGGNIPVDSAVFLDFVPGAYQYLMAVMSIFWTMGQILASLAAWPLIANFSCEPTATECRPTDNRGWRYLLFTLGGLTLLLSCISFFSFTLLESPRFLIGTGNDKEAVAVIHKMAEYNSTTSHLTIEHLIQASQTVNSPGPGLETRHRVLSESSCLNMRHIKALFATPKMAWSTSLLISIWGIIGLGSTLYNSFLPYLLTSRGASFGDGSLNLTYRNQVILHLMGIPGSCLTGWAVEVPYIGRRRTLAIASGKYSDLIPRVFVIPTIPLANTALTGVFLFASTTARNSKALLGWNCGYAFHSSIMFGVLYTVSPEIFPAKDRGTGNSLTAMATRIFGIMAPIIALYANISTAVPVYIAGALFISAGLLALLLPYEPRGKASI